MVMVMMVMAMMVTVVKLNALSDGDSDGKGMYVEVNRMQFSQMTVKIKFIISCSSPGTRHELGFPSTLSLCLSVSPFFLFLISSCS